MQAIIDKFKNIIFMIFSGTIFTILVGFVFFRNQIAVYTHPAFQFIVYGFVLSLLISVVKTYQKRTFIYIASMVVFLLPFTTNSIQKLLINSIIRDLTFGIIMVITIFIAYEIYKAIHNMKKILNEIVLWTLSVILAYLISSIVLSIIFKHTVVLQYLAYQFRFGLLIGISVSIGTKIGEKIKPATI